jgi:hypothetical protein
MEEATLEIIRGVNAHHEEAGQLRPLRAAGAHDRAGRNSGDHAVELPAGTEKPRQFAAGVSPRELSDDRDQKLR